jgi:hypothetical protein
MCCVAVSQRVQANGWMYLAYPTAKKVLKRHFEDQSQSSYRYILKEAC